MFVLDTKPDQNAVQKVFKMSLQCIPFSQRIFGLNDHRKLKFSR
jgi:hypothetical protein